MKKILLSLFAILTLTVCIFWKPLVGLSSNTEINNLVGQGMSPELAAQIDKQYATALSQSLVPATTNVVSLGSVSKFIKQADISNIAVAYETGAAAGSSSTDAHVLSATKMVHQVTSANGTLGVRLPVTSAATVGNVHIILNTTAGVLKIYADTGGTVNGGSVDAAFSALTGIKPIICISTALLTYICA